MKLSTKHYLDKIARATLATAEEWYADDEQFIYCVDWLEISAHDSRADALVEIMEDYLTDILNDWVQPVMPYWWGIMGCI